MFCFLFLQIKPLVKPTKFIVDTDNLQYSWHDFVSRSKLPPCFTLYTLKKHWTYSKMLDTINYVSCYVESVSNIHSQVENFIVINDTSLLYF